MTNIVKITTSVNEIYDDDAYITEVFGQGCNYRTKFGVNCFIVTLDVKVSSSMDDKIHNFTCQYESEDRFNNIKAYNGVDMESSDYGEQGKLFEFLENIDFKDTKLFLDNNGIETEINDLYEVKKHLIHQAEQECLTFFEKHLSDILEYDDIQNSILSEFKKYDDYHLFSDDEIQYVIYQETKNILKSEFMQVVDGNLKSIEYDNSEYHSLISKAEDIAEERYNEMGEINLTDEELLENLDDIDLVFINIYQRAIEDVTEENNKNIYISFVEKLNKLLNPESETIVNIWHVEQNDLKPIAERDSIKKLCYAKTHDLINEKLNDLSYQKPTISM